MRISRDRLLNYGLTVSVACAVLLTGIRVRDFVQSRPSLGLEKGEKIRNWEAYAVGGVRVGPTDARVTVVEFSDYLCPFCRLAAPALHALRQRYPKEVAVVYRNFVVHGEAYPAAVSAVC